MNTSTYRFDEDRGHWVTPEGEPICAIILEPRDFEDESQDDESCRLEWFLDLDAEDLPPFGSEERRKLLRDAMIDAEKFMPDYAYEIVRDAVRDALRKRLRELREAPAREEVRKALGLPEGGAE